MSQILKSTLSSFTTIFRIMGIMGVTSMMLGTALAELPRSPTALALSPDQKNLYVAELSGGSIATVDAKNLKLLRKVTL